MVSRVQQVPSYVEQMAKGEKAVGGAPAAGSGYVEDGTVDLHGNSVLKSKTGGWKACPYILGTIDTFLLLPRVQFSVFENLRK